MSAVWSGLCAMCAVAAFITGFLGVGALLTADDEGRPLTRPFWVLVAAVPLLTGLAVMFGGLA